MSLSWIADRRVAAMAMPWPDELDTLVAVGIGAMVSLTERLPEGLPHRGLQHLHLPVRDFRPPTQEQLDRAVAFIDEALADGRAVVVHCGAGLGRTGTICAAWLAAQTGDAAEAIAEVRRRRPGAVETREQEQAVAEFVRRRRGGGR